MAQVCWLGPKVHGRLALFCIHRVNWVNSRNDYRVMRVTESWWQHHKHYPIIIIIIGLDWAEFNVLLLNAAQYLRIRRGSYRWRGLSVCPVDKYRHVDIHSLHHQDTCMDDTGAGNQVSGRHSNRQRTCRNEKSMTQSRFSKWLKGQNPLHLFLRLRGSYEEKYVMDFGLQKARSHSFMCRAAPTFVLCPQNQTNTILVAKFNAYFSAA